MKEDDPPGSLVFLKTGSKQDVPGNGAPGEKPQKKSLTFKKEK
jgi:hypothetical protein